MQNRNILFLAAVLVVGLSVCAHAQNTSAPIIAASDGTAISVPGSAARVDFGALSNGGQAAAASTDEEIRHEVFFQVGGWFTKDSTTASIPHTSTSAAELNAGYRYHFNHWAAAEFDYDYTRFTNKYIGSGAPEAVQSKVSGFTGNFVMGPRRALGFRPFALVGGGVIVFTPTNNAGGTTPGNTRQTKGTFDFGGGLDYAFSRHLAVRAEYRGFVYKVPNFGLTILNTNKTTISSVPTVGVVFTF